MGGFSKNTSPGGQGPVHPYQGLISELLTALGRIPSPPHEELTKLLHNLAKEEDAYLLIFELENLAYRLKRLGKNTEAAITFQFLKGLPKHPTTPLALARKSEKEITTQLNLILGKTEGISWGDRLEHYISTGSESTLAADISYGGALLGLGTILCSYIRPLRPLAAAGVSLLSRPTVAATLLATGGMTLYQQYPYMAEAWNRLNNHSYPSPYHTPWGDRLMLASYALGIFGISVGTLSFALGARTMFLHRGWALKGNYTPRGAWRVGMIQGDSVRRAVQDPNLWIHWAQGSSHLSPWQRSVISFSGRWTNRTLLGGSAMVGGGRFIHDYHQLQKRQETITLGLWASLITQASLDIFPGVTVALYRAGRGHRRYNLGPALSQEITEVHYTHPVLRARALDRLERGIFPLSPLAKENYLQTSFRELQRVHLMQQKAEGLSPLSGEGPNAPSFRPLEGENLYAPPSRRVYFPIEARHPHLQGEGARRKIAELPLADLRKAYLEGKISPTGMLRLIWDHPATRDTALFPLPLRNSLLGELLLARAKLSEYRFEAKPKLVRPLEGVFVAVKDLFPSLDSNLTAGTKTGRLSGIEFSPMVQQLLDLGAIPVPVGMSAAGSGGSGLHAGWGYIPHPTRPGLDPGGSSSGTAHVVGLKDFPITVGIGTDTGGSVTAPAGAVGLHSVVPPRGMISTKNMVPFDTYLDRVGILSQNSKDAWTLVQLLSKPIPGDPHMVNPPASAKFSQATLAPRIVYLESLLKGATPAARGTFLKRMETLKSQGFEVRSLDNDWNFIAEVPPILYTMDAYGAGVYSYTNPLKGHLWEPPRRTMDVNLQQRLAKGGLSLSHGLFDQARNLNSQYQNLVRRLFGEHTVLASPSPESIPTRDLIHGRAESKILRHDLLTQGKNRIPEWGQVNIPDQVNPQVGVTYSSTLPNLLYLWKIKGGAR